MSEGLQVVYDGECPFCRSYVSVLRLRETVGPVDLIDARRGGAVVEQVRLAGHDLNAGMVAIWQGRMLHGAEAVQLLASLSARGGLLNGLQRRVMRSPRASRLLYPWLVRGRLAWFRITGSRAIE